MACHSFPYVDIDFHILSYFRVQFLVQSKSTQLQLRIRWLIRFPDQHALLDKKKLFAKRVYKNL